MAGGKETPRQKMISMMYLVLTALLAMNVSKSILDSFLIINEGLTGSNELFSQKNKLALDAFEAEAAKDPKFAENLGKAKAIKKSSQNLFTHIEKLKRYLIAATDGLDTTITVLMAPGADTVFTINKASAKDNYDIPTEKMIGTDENKPKEATVQYSALQLRKMIEDHKKLVLGSFKKEDDEKFFKSLSRMLNLDEITESDGKKVSWELGNFYHMPLAAIVTNLSRIQLEVNNMEADVLTKLMGNVNAKRFKVDNLQARVIPNTTYVMMGDSFYADIFVSASSTSIVPEVYVGPVDETGKLKGTPTRVDNNIGGGMVRYGLRTSSLGEVLWGGYIEVQKPDGSGKDHYEIAPQKYRVAQKSLTVSATKMNVFYRDLENPVNVSAPGVANEDLTVSITNGSISPVNKGNGEWMVKPGTGEECIITLGTKGKGNLGSKNFRVKNVPPPTPYFANVTGSGSVTAIALQAALGVSARLEGFVFDGIKYDVTEFTMSSVVKGNLVEKKTKGNRVTEEMKALLGAARSGSKIFIEGIKAQGPGGKVVSLGSIILKVN